VEEIEGVADHIMLPGMTQRLKVSRVPLRGARAGAQPERGPGSQMITEWRTNRNKTSNFYIIEAAF